MRMPSNLSVTYSKVDSFDMYLQLGQKAYELRSVTHGGMAGETMSSLYHLAECYNMCKRYGEALPAFEKLCQFRMDTAGAEHPDTMEIQGKIDEIERKPVSNER